MANNSIQFFGVDPVIKAAENRSCPNWAIFQGKQFLFKYEGRDQEESSDFLNTILTSLTTSGSQAIYTICFYEEAEKIKQNTPHDGSFNFRLVTEAEREQKTNSYSESTRQILNKLESLENRLELMEVDPDNEEDEEPAGINGIVLGLLKEPEKLQQLLAIGKSLLGIGQATLSRPVQMAGVNDTEKETAIFKAIERLKAIDPELPAHLTKLADLAEKDTATFNYLLSMLKKL